MNFTISMNVYESVLKIENPLNSYCQKTLNPYKSTFSMLKLVKNRVKVTLRPAARPWQLFERLPAEGVEHTEKYCVGSCIKFASWDRVRVGFTQCGVDKTSSIFSALFKGICWVVAIWLIGQKFSELWHHENCAHKKMAQLIRNKQLSLISGPWHLIGSGISGRVLCTCYLSCLGRVVAPLLLGGHLHFIWGTIESLESHDS